MEEHQFQRLLNLFPIVRSPDYCAEDTREGASSDRHSLQLEEISTAGTVCGADEHGKADIDLFWIHLREFVQSKLNHEDAVRFCDAFSQVHNDLVRKLPMLESIEKAAVTTREVKLGN